MKYANFENYADISWDGYEAECEKVHEYHRRVKKEWKKAKSEKKEKAWLRQMCRTDLYFLLFYVLGRKDVGYIIKEKTGKRVERPWLFRRCAEIQANPDGYLDIWARDHYKDIYDDTPLWTTDGWKTQGTVQVGDTVMTPTGFSKVVAVRHFTDSHCKQINFRSGEKIVCGNGHLWKAFRFNSRRVSGNTRVGWQESICETADLINSYRHPYIKACSGFDSQKSELPIDPYLLGLWIGDGTSTSGQITSADKEVWQAFKNRGWEISKRIGKAKGLAETRTVYGFQVELRKLGVLNNKHIPLEYLCSSFEDRLELLKGLMDTDGFICDREDDNSCTFVQKKYNIIQDVVVLATSLGYKCRVCKQPKAYYLAFSVKQSDPIPFNLPRKVARVNRSLNNQKQSSNWHIQSIDEHETVPTTCIQIENKEGMYLVGSSMIPTHNSSLITYAKTIQDILINPEITVCIYAYNMGLAKKMLLQIKNTFESCENLKQLFPDILYKSPSETGWKDKDGVWRKRVWTDEKITVKRFSNPKESTIECSGLVEGQRTGGHYNLLIFDDTVTLDSVRTPEQIKKTTEALFMAIRTGSTANLKMRFIGTRYALYDTYHTVLERGMVKARIHPCYFLNENGTLSENPVLYSNEEIDLKRINSAYGVFETQELCDPKANLVASFDRDWIEIVDSYDFSKPINMAVICDPAGSLKTKSDYTVFWVVGRSSDDIFYFFDLVRDKILNDKKWEVLKELVAQYTFNDVKPHVYYEQVSMQSDIQYFQKMMSLDHFSFDITPVSGRPKIRMGGSISGMPTKVQRIEALPPLFKQRRIKFVRMSERFSNYEQKLVDMFNQFVEEEYSAYPSGKHDDCLDCMSRIADLETGVMLVKPDKKSVRKINKKPNQYDVYQIESEFTPY